MKSAHKKAVFGKVIVYAILILIAVVMILSCGCFPHPSRVTEKYFR